MNNRRLLVTGGAGFIGTNFVHYWTKWHPMDRVVVLDSLTYAGNLANLEAVNGSPSYRFVHGDIRDEQLVVNLLREECLDSIVHFAAESHVDRSILGPDAFIETNVVGTHTLLKAARIVWLESADSPRQHRFHHISTDEVYGSLSPKSPAFLEMTPYDPSSPYAASKAASDHLVRAYHRTYGLEVSISNCSNNYGPFHFPEKLIPLSIVNILHGRPVCVYGDGLNVRDWLYVEDHCRGIDYILERGSAGETYNIGGQNEHTNIDVVLKICDLLDAAFEREPHLRETFRASPAGRPKRAKSLIRFVKDRPGHDRRYAVNPKKIFTQLGFRPQVAFETGIKKTIEWYLSQEEWWRSGSYTNWIHTQ
ncbi:MAG: dTDP-glucose 4,6-dehydratase [Gammaproteobacteria bacterium]|nr:dTDP-glucose 4,6-dehydratase [Gammaproteobacteria bacterium]